MTALCETPNRMSECIKLDAEVEYRHTRWGHISPYYKHLWKVLSVVKSLPTDPSVTASKYY